MHMGNVFGPSPVAWDKVETAIYDALQLILVTSRLFDGDTRIYNSYFDRKDRAKVKAVYDRLAGVCQTGHADLRKIVITDTDSQDDCHGPTRAYMVDYTTDHPRITICPLGMLRKAYTKLQGARNPENNPEYYVRCKELTEAGHISNNMTTLGSVLMHEYTHWDTLLHDVVGAEIDDRANGPTQVFAMNQKYGKVNADSYTFYSLELFWSYVCKTTFTALRKGIDNLDIDCPPEKPIPGGGVQPGCGPRSGT
ncbi:MAG: hypothetical protein Q9218_007391 [Villophora microphyllina]